jgi:hypothetical protein
VPPGTTRKRAFTAFMSIEGAKQVESHRYAEPRSGACRL